MLWLGVFSLVLPQSYRRLELSLCSAASDNTRELLNDLQLKGADENNRPFYTETYTSFSESFHPLLVENYRNCNGERSIWRKWGSSVDKNSALVWLHGAEFQFSMRHGERIPRWVDKLEGDSQGVGGSIFIAPIVHVDPLSHSRLLDLGLPFQEVRLSTENSSLSPKYPRLETNHYNLKETRDNQQTSQFDDAFVGRQFLVFFSLVFGGLFVGVCGTNLIDRKRRLFGVVFVVGGLFASFLGFVLWWRI